MATECGTYPGLDPLAAKSFIRTIDEAYMGISGMHGSNIYLIVLAAKANSLPVLIKMAYRHHQNMKRIY